MAFNELDLKRIDNCVDTFCRRRTRPVLADQLRFLYEIHGQSVVIAEECPGWGDPSRRMRTPVGKLHFVRATGLWTLYWMRADLTWHVYQPATPSRDLATLVGVVDRDEYCAFFG